MLMTNNENLVQLETEIAKYQNENKILIKKIETINDTHYHAIT
jgi:hypothetical protein